MCEFLNAYTARRQSRAGFLLRDKLPREAWCTLNSCSGSNSDFDNSTKKWYYWFRWAGAWNAMNKKQEKTLEAIFEDPVRANIDWRDVESLLKSLAAVITEGRGSRVRVSLNGVRAVFHEPHPEKEMQKGTIRSLRGFLMQAGVEIDDQNIVET
jgi:hypothetical protein